ncbi:MULTISPECIES: hypothetical protein [Olivibacter]|jgi:hypothetical protein|uniref:Uncharacterized protein n=2 Tax=Olivibacter TaxID=376469 RepID=A0ABV6HQL6_9SPHI|nr:MULTISPECIES: hypothetical protein [Olivibacter]MDX3917448.1 hypothetical protein [Pseudosphingobacterium sp.]QEL03951.1 hypothetical protein FKG96_24995 [Olivibacter sp. LS-1]
MTIVLKIVAAILLGLSLVFLLWENTDFPNKRSNGFFRKFLDIELQDPKRINFGSPLREIIYFDDSKILFSTDSPGIIKVLHLSALRTETLQWNLSDSLKAIIGSTFSYSMSGNCDDVTLFAKKLASIFELEPLSQKRITDNPFSYALRISRHSFVIRQYSRNTKDMRFRYINTNDPISQWEHDITFKSNNSGLSTDGQLHYAEAFGLCIYMHYYNNNIVIFDTTLHRKKTLNTIDTIKYNPDMDRRKPLLVTNKKSCIYKNLIFVCSNLKADNEERQKYLKNVPVDIYDFMNEKYKGSFYLPLHNNKIFKSLAYNKGVIAALYYDNIVLISRIRGLNRLTSH